MIYTSYFANVNKLPKDFVKVSISRFPPKWLEGQIKQCSVLAPSAELLKAYKSHQISDLEYIDWYKQQISSLPIETKRKLFNRLKFYANSSEHNLVLLCYEVPGQFCHRHIFADMCSPTFSIKEYYPC